MRGRRGGDSGLEPLYIELPLDLDERRYGAPLAAGRERSDPGFLLN